VFWTRVVEMLRQGMTLDQIEARLEHERREELAALDREHKRRMMIDIYIPFAAGLASLGWCVGVIAAGGPVWLAIMSIPGVAWCQWKLAAVTTRQ